MITLPFLLLLIGLLYIVLFGGLTYIRREGLSIQFALEGLAITLLMSGATLFTDADLDPIFFLVILYLITMRIRLILDLANFIGKRKNYRLAGQLYHFALKSFPDATNRLIIYVNQGVSMIKQGNWDSGIQILNQVLSQKENGHLGIKTETACYYNLAIAYRRKGSEKASLDYFQKVIDTWPASIYSSRALIELQKNKAQAGEKFNNQE